MKILLTGSAGQVGTDLIPRLLSRGAKVTCFDLAKAPSSLPSGVEWRERDVTVPGEVYDVVQEVRPDAIFHLAAILSASGERKPHTAWRVNMEGTLNVLEAARLFGVRQVLFTSTIAAFGPGLPDPVGNDVSMRPTTMYGVTKVAGELLGEYYAKKWKLDFRGVRFPGLISAIEPHGGTSDYVVYMYVHGVRHGAYEAFARADTRIPLMYMPDALRAMVELSEADPKRLKHGMYNIAAMSPRADEIAAAVARHIPGVRLTFAADPMRQGILDSWPRALDDSAARDEWGWKAEYDLEAMSHDLLVKITAREPSPKIPYRPDAPASKPTSTKAVAAKAPAPKPASPKPAVPKPAVVGKKRG